MCLNPRFISSKTKYVDVTQLGSYLGTQIYCGKCAECRKMKVAEYYARIKSLYKDCIAHGGFCYWDCLTYDDASVPVYTIARGLQRSKLMFKDDYSILTFNSDDYRNYMKRLRINIQRAGYDNKLKYYWVCEYGGITHRPHYHIIYFIYDKTLSPEVFDSLIVKSWKYGINDKYNKDGSLKSPQSKVVNGDGAIYYVAKYVVKDDEYLKVIDEFAKTHNLDSDTYKSLMPFHRQSQGFGESIIEQNDVKFLFDTGKMVVDTPDGKVTQSIPTYILRKMFFQNIKQKDGTYRWIPTQKGYDYLVNLFQTKIDRAEKRINDTIALGSALDWKNYPFNPVERFKKLIGARSSRSLARYQLYYKGRVLPLDYDFSNPPNILDVLKHYYEEKQIDYSRVHSNPDIYENLLDLNNIYHLTDSGNYQSISGNDVYSKNNFLDKFVTDESSYIGFKDFDECIEYLNIISYANSLKTQEKYDEVQSIQKRLRKLKEKYSVE